MESKVLLWLDDVRDPNTHDWLNFSAVPDYTKVVWVKSHKEFVSWIEENGLPYAINFDHDLADEHYTPKIHWDIEDKDEAYEKSTEWASKQNFKEKTGFDSAKWLVDYCLDNSEVLPRWYTHSANPVGRDNIDKYLINFLRHHGDLNRKKYVKEAHEHCGSAKEDCCNNPSWCKKLGTENNLGDKLT